VKNSEFPEIFKITKKNKKRFNENGNFYAKPVFEEIELIVFYLSQK